MDHAREEYLFQYVMLPFYLVLLLLLSLYHVCYFKSYKAELETSPLVVVSLSLDVRLLLSGRGGRIVKDMQRPRWDEAKRSSLGVVEFGNTLSASLLFRLGANSLVKYEMLT